MVEEHIKKKEDFELEREVIRRIKKGNIQKKPSKQRKPSNYVKISNNFFSKQSINLYKTPMFKSLEKNLIKANLQYLPISYISVTLFTTLLSFIFGIFLFIILLFVNFSLTLPFVSLVQEDILTRILKTIWIIIVIPIITFFVMYLYPGLEKSSLENKINRELPFVTINMSAIAGSMVEPSKTFEIIAATGEYPAITREFTKIINEINIYGYDLVSALRKSADNTASKKLSELYNGLATSIGSGGNLPEFFDKRSQNLLFDYKLERERKTRSSETFMDIYISVVIAAPMLLMLLLMMISIGNLGISLSTGMITLLMILGVIGINIVFITFLYLKQSQE